MNIENLFASVVELQAYDRSAFMWSRSTQLCEEVFSSFCFLRGNLKERLQNIPDNPLRYWCLQFGKISQRICWWRNL